jgi:hypothetical protein
MTTIIIFGPQRAVADHQRFRFVADGLETFVEISDSAWAIGQQHPEALPSPVCRAVETRGLSAVERELALGHDLPRRIFVEMDRITAESARPSL